MDIRRPNRVTRSYTQRLDAPPSRVLPLLCPVREADWLAGWDPVRVLSESGRVEPDCVFETASPRAAAGDARKHTLWYVTRVDAEAGHVEMIRIAPGVTACRLTIRLAAADAGCEATVSYVHTSLGPDGDAFVAAFTEDHYRSFMQDWERRLNHYLTTGHCLT